MKLIFLIIHLLILLVNYLAIEHFEVFGFGFWNSKKLGLRFGLDFLDLFKKSKSKEIKVGSKFKTIPIWQQMASAGRMRIPPSATYIIPPTKYINKIYKSVC